MTKFRIHRTYKWEIYNPEKRLGGTRQYHLVASDELQYHHEQQIRSLNGDCHELIHEWRAVQVVEAPKPEYPKE